MTHAEHTIHPLFHDHPLGLPASPHLRERAAVRDGPIPPPPAPGLQGEHHPHLDPGGEETMPVGCVRRANGTTPMGPRQPDRQEPIASAKGALPAIRISWTKRSCRVYKSRSLRPFTCGECAGISSTPNSRSARPN
jgi:hypothetical protein